MRSLLTCLAGVLSLGLVAPAMVADGHQALRTPVDAALPAVAVEQLPAHSPEGRLLGTLVLPSIVDRAARDPARPVLVVFNGGPGAASAWLQLGLLGPWRADVPDDPAVPLGNFLALQPNHGGLWDRADILFVDPLGTGFSRIAPGVDPQLVRDWRRDGDYLAEALSTWLARHGRSEAPLILLGESYGAERAVAVADALSRGRHPARLAGVALISQTVTTDAALRHRGGNLANGLALPTIAATACYLGRSGLAERDPARCAELSERFAANYDPRARAELARLTGLPEAHFARADLTLDRGDYRRRAIAGRVLGMYDSRYSAPVPRAGRWEDPSLDPLLPAMQDAADRYARAVLRIERSPVDGSRYVLFDPATHATWRYGDHADPYGRIDIAAVLRRVLHRSGARLLVAGGMFDTVGSYGGDRYLARQVGLPPSRVTVRAYPAGHMFYLDGTSRRAFLPLLRDFVSPPRQVGTRRA